MTQSKFDFTCFTGHPRRKLVLRDVGGSGRAPGQIQQGRRYFLNNRGSCQTIGGTKGFITSSARRRRTSFGRILNIVV
jgi:hypothetical protein